MNRQAKSNKTLRQYRRDQEDVNLQKTGSSFEDLTLCDPLHQAQPEQALWRAVILQMITDALSNSQKRDHLRFKKDAWHWLTSHSRDFRIVCDYAGYDPEWLQEQINQFLSKHENPYLQARKKKAALERFTLSIGLQRSPHQLSPINYQPQLSYTE